MLVIFWALTLLGGLLVLVLFYGVFTGKLPGDMLFDLLGQEPTEIRLSSIVNSLLTIGTACETELSKKLAVDHLNLKGKVVAWEIQIKDTDHALFSKSHICIYSTVLRSETRQPTAPRDSFEALSSEYANNVRVRAIFHQSKLGNLETLIPGQKVRFKGRVTDVSTQYNNNWWVWVEFCELLDAEEKTW